MSGYKLIMEKFVVTNPKGLDLRCVRMLVQTTLQFEAEVEVKYGNATVDGKSLLDLLALGVSRGAVVNVSVFGCDAPQAFYAIEQLFNYAFFSDVVPEDQRWAVA
jgi:phosphotransferase system HPr (HPr) family protein